MRGQGKKRFHIGKGEKFILTGRGADIYRGVMEAERGSLYASPERVLEIERRQPQATEWGRSLFFRPGTPLARERKSRSVVEEPNPQNGRAPWRKTFEFEGQEDELLTDGDADILLDVGEPGEAEEVLAAAS